MSITSPRSGAPVFDAAQLSQEALARWYETCGKPALETLDWADYKTMINLIRSAFRNRTESHSFRYHHPVNLQDPDLGVGRPYSVPIVYSDGPYELEPVIAIGGLINTKERFDFLASNTISDLRILAIDLSGRGASGWLTELSDYHTETYIEQVRQFMDHLNLTSCTLLGSSLGGSISIQLAARYPERIKRIILNDNGPFIPATRRKRRARAVGRHYVFDTPSEMFRKTAISSKNSGPAPDAVLLYNQHFKTRWSDEEQGRVYRHDIRAMLAYRSEAVRNLELWSEWNQVQCPVLVLHGLESDALHNETIDRMRSNKQLSVIHVLDTGHTPSLGDKELNQLIAEWVLDDRPCSEDIYFNGQYRPDRLFLPRL